MTYLTQDWALRESILHSKEVSILYDITLTRLNQEREDVWKSINEFSEELRRSGRMFSDSVELIREGRGE